MTYRDYCDIIAFFAKNSKQNSLLILYHSIGGQAMNNIIDFTKVKQKRTSYGGDNMCSILEKIKNKNAIDLLNAYDIKLEPPIDISSLLDKIGISVIAKDFSDIEKTNDVEPGSILGAAMSKGDNLAIFYRKADTYNRKIFTIAHELGHCCKHSENLKISHIEFRINGDIHDPHEIEANIFAGELLIPKPLLLKKYKEFIIPSLKALSIIFGVSTNVMAARLDYLGLDYFKDIPLSEE